MHTIAYDSSRSYQDAFKYLGSNQDPIFGRTDADIFTRFSMPNNVSSITFGDDVVLDSAVMLLTFTGKHTGDTSTALNYQVYQLNADLAQTTAYYMNDNVSYNATPLCNKTCRLSFSGGFYNIRLPIDNNFASALLSNPQYLVDNNTFISTYKGFYITTRSTNNLNPVSAQGALMKIDLDNPVSGVYMYYHNGTQSASKQSKVYQFLFKGDVASRFNKINYNYAAGASANELVKQLSGDSLKSAPANVFLKGVAGAKAVIRLPYIKNYSDSSRIAIGRAEFVFKVDQAFASVGGKYDAPLQISLVAIDDNHHELYVKDQYYYSDLIRFGGDYDADNKQYVFNVARHLQDIVDGKITNNGFYLVVANPDKAEVTRRDVESDRVVLGGPKNSLYKPLFKLTYVRFPYDK